MRRPLNALVSHRPTIAVTRRRCRRPLASTIGAVPRYAPSRRGIIKLTDQPTACVW